jgi:hypothetical protein
MLRSAGIRGYGSDVIARCEGYGAGGRERKGCNAPRLEQFPHIPNN